MKFPGLSSQHTRLLVRSIYGVAALLLAGELLLPGRSLYRWDTLIYTWPLVLEARAQWLSGQIPFWASSICCGTPLLANINAGVLYPLRVIHDLLPLRPGYHLFLAAHVWLSLAGMHLLLHRRLRLTRIAAAVGAIAYTACGYARGMWDTHNFLALPWIPLGLAALLACGTGPRSMARGVLGASVCWAMLLLGGDFQSACLWAPAALLLAGLHPRRRTLLPALGAAIVVGALLAAPQWLPTVRATADSYRAHGIPYADAIERSLHPVRLLEWCVPHLFGTRANWLGPVLTDAAGGPQLPWTTSIHVGRLAFGLALFALVRRYRPVTCWAGLLVAFGTLLSFGGHLPAFREWLALPIVGSFRYPEKYILWASFGLAVLAARGAQRWLALLRAGRARLAGRLLAGWCAVLLAVGLGGVRALLDLAPHAADATRWAESLNSGLLSIVCIALAGLLVVYRLGRGAAPVLLALVLIDGVMAWFAELPTTARWDPLRPPIVAQFIRASDGGDGRVLRDPAVAGAPSENNIQDLSLQERYAGFMRDVLDFNSARLWGLRTADGFSPIESAGMRAYRVHAAKPPRSGVPSAEQLSEFCRTTGVEWLITTGARAAALEAAGLGARRANAWGPPQTFELLRVHDAVEAVCAAVDPAAPAPAAVVLGLRRPAPGYLRVDLEPGGPTVLTVRETWADGWQAVDQNGAALEMARTPQALMQFHLPAGVRQVRMQYRPAGWGLGLLLGGIGLACVAMLAVTRAALVRWARSPVAAMVVSLCLATAIGVAARGNWSCTFDEGFHVTRGVMHLATGDSRLGIFHPPIQNLVCAVLADLAFGEQWRIPHGPAWESADLWGTSTNLALLNRTIFPQIVRAARWGTTLFTILAIGVGVWWAFRAGGPAAAWLAGFGLALSPAMLAHGNLVTSDMGLTAFALLGTALLWRATAEDPNIDLSAVALAKAEIRRKSEIQNAEMRAGRRFPFSLFDIRASFGFRYSDFGFSPRGFPLWPATFAFAAAALTKHSGLVWFLGYLLLAVPALAVARRSMRPLWQLAIGGVVFVALLITLYGPLPQEVRVGPASWWHGRSIPAGRYVEGLISQAQHSLSGQRAFFHGVRLESCPWWVNLAQLALKNPPLWCLAALAGAAGWCRRRRPLQDWVPLMPVAVFIALWLGANHLAIGVRHVLALVALGTVLGAVWAARLPQRAWRLTACWALALASLAAASAYPNYISYYPQWAGGVRGGHRWMVDSNYDWGQELDTLERHWPALLDANGGKPPHLLYFGFLDPSSMYGMPVAEPSLLGFMGRTMNRGSGGTADTQWLEHQDQMKGTVVASVSALELDPYGVDLSWLRAAPTAGSIANTFRVLVPSAMEPAAELR